MESDRIGDCAPNRKAHRSRPINSDGDECGFRSDREPDERKPRPHSEAAPLDEPKRVLAAKPQPFRIQFVGAAPGPGLTILSEVEIQASDVSAAIVAAANLAFPPKTVALRILDREGQAVFERCKADRK
jgi:hypothetical protein